MSKLKALLPPLAVAALLLVVWWIVVVESETVIFPTPLQVVTAAIDLVRDGTLWDHIGASLFRVGAGFLGGFLLRSLLRITDARISCMVRANNSDGRTRIRPRRCA